MCCGKSFDGKSKEKSWRYLDRFISEKKGLDVWMSF